jgi:site-specific DNA recombinase
VHEPLIDDQLWQAYLDARARRRGRPARTERSQYLLSGLVRCGRCGGSMVAGQFGHATSRSTGARPARRRAPRCAPGGYVMASYLERLVLEDLQRVADLVDEHTDANAASTARRTAVRSETRRLAREIGRIEDAMGRLAVQHAKSPLPEQVQPGPQDELAAELVALQAALEDAGAGSAWVGAAALDTGAAAAGVVGHAAGGASAGGAADSGSSARSGCGRGGRGLRCRSCTPGSDPSLQAPVTVVSGA